MKALKEIKDSEKLKEKKIANRKSRGGNKIKAIKNQNASWASTYTNGRFRKNVKVFEYRKNYFRKRWKANWKKKF